MDPFITPGAAISAVSLIITGTDFYLKNRKVKKVDEIRNTYYLVKEKKDIHKVISKDDFHQITKYLAQSTIVSEHIKRKISRDFIIAISAILTLVIGYFSNTGDLLSGYGFKYLGFDGMFFLSGIVLVSMIQWISSNNKQEFMLIENVIHLEDYLYRNVILGEITKLNKELENNGFIKSSKVKKKISINKFIQDLKNNHAIKILK